MNNVTYNGEIYTVEEEFNDYYRLSGSLWVKKELCNQVPELTLFSAIKNEFKNIPITKLTLIVIYLFLIFHIIRIIIINIKSY